MPVENLIQIMTYSDDMSGTPIHSHNNYQLIYIKKGNLIINVSSKSYRASAPSVVFISNLEMHDIKVLSDCYERYYINISPGIANETIKSQKLLTIFNNRPAGFRHVLDVKGLNDLKNNVEYIFDRLYEEVRCDNSYKDEMSALLVKELLILIYRQFPNAFPVYNDTVINTIMDIKQYLETNYQKSISLAEIAHKYNLSVYYLAHKFKMVTGYSVKQYIQCCRLSHARELLCCTNKSITEIAMESGFSDISNFGRFFRRETGCTPTMYRKKYYNG